MVEQIIAILMVFLAVAGFAWALLRTYRAIVNKSLFTNRKADLHDVVSKLDRVTSDLNSLAEQIYSLQGQVDLLNYYESTLKVQEQLLLVMNKLVETEVSQMSLDSANYLASDLEARITRLNSGFASVRKTGKVNMDELLGRPPQKIKRKACYFCSRPISNATQSKTTVSDGGRERKVLACPVCLITIKETGTAKVLQFDVNGRQIHWSEYKDFLPNQEYWNINRPSGSKKKPRLSLVDSVVSVQDSNSDKGIDPSLH